MPFFFLCFGVFSLSYLLTFIVNAFIANLFIVHLLKVCWTILWPLSAACLSSQRPRLQQSTNEHNFLEFVRVSHGASSSSHTQTAGTRTEAHSWEGEWERQMSVAAASKCTTSRETGRGVRKHIRRLSGYNAPLMRLSLHF